jgi:hypothetical protein
MNRVLWVCAERRGARDDAGELQGINPIIVVSAEVLQFSASRTIPISAVEIPSAIHLESSLKRCGDLEDRIKY